MFEEKMTSATFIFVRAFLLSNKLQAFARVQHNINTWWPKKVSHYQMTKKSY